MHKRYQGLSASWMVAFCIPFGVKANGVVSYKLNTITIASTGAMDAMVTTPYQRLLKWLTPTTHPSLICSAICLAPGTTFDEQALLSTRARLMTLPYFATVSVARKGEGNNPIPSELIIKTKDRFPITIDLNLDAGPLLTITHHNAWGYGHTFSQQLFLKKRWGYGLSYALPNGNYFFGGRYYNQYAVCNKENSYRFNDQNLWIGKLFAIHTKQPFSSYYWITGLSGYKKTFATAPPLSAMKRNPDYTFMLGKLGWVADKYQSMHGVYSLHALESLPKGGSIEILYGYQNGALHKRHYMGLNCIKNIAHPRLKYLHLSCESGTFIHNQALEEAILKLALAYAGPPIQTCNGARQFIAIDYIMGYRMPKERMLGIRQRDPEALELPDEDNRMQAPIHTRVNIHLDSTLHMPITVHHIRFTCLAFAHFIALYNQDSGPLHETCVDRYGLGLQLAHLTIPWLAGSFKMGYSPLLGKVVPSIQLAMEHFKNKTDPNPRLVAYS